MIELLVQAKDEAHQCGAPLPAQRQLWYAQQWSALLERGERQHPEAIASGAPSGKRGRPRQSKAFNLLGRLRLRRDDVWRFMTEAGVPLTNNLAEQALRMSKVRQKISGCLSHACRVRYVLYHPLLPGHHAQAGRWPVRVTHRRLQGTTGSTLSAGVS